ncbi:DUF58 domain-containing protein [Jatrophihabitans sp.]|uniref:DUF58 domain-containing protein n=1 Tax=Jatrophihabitans sp. TaxID=1932789 RepID=UPI0030C7642F|nr:uncharacterized protein [Jatrophihabitans sp.]
MADLTSDAEPGRVLRLRRALARRAAPVTSTVTRVGWGFLVATALAWLVGAELGWIEFRYIATACLFVFVLSSLLTIGRTSLAVTLELDPRRVVAGSSAGGRVLVRNVSRRRLLPFVLEVPIGASAPPFPMPTLAGGAEADELFSVSTARRGVIAVGPATSVRGDPLGLLRRSVRWTETLELFVHPITVPLEPLGAGLLRDLEGQTTNETSMSDLAFHALRDYAPGDDRRYIHWRSSAKVGSTTEAGKFLVRQFLDTRRSHLTVIVDGQPTSYLDVIDFETAISAAASVALRAITDEVPTTVLAAQHAVNDASLALTLDTFARAEAGGDRLGVLASQATIMAPDTSVALLVSGAEVGFGELQRAASYFAPEVKVIAVRVDPTRQATIAAPAGLTVVTLPQLSSLAALLAGVGA